MEPRSRSARRHERALSADFGGRRIANEIIASIEVVEATIIQFWPTYNSPHMTPPPNDLKAAPNDLPQARAAIWMR